VNANLTLQDGYASGQLLKVSINDAGQVVGNYSNGKVLTLAQISVVQFNGDDGLQRLDGGVYAQTLESGQPLVGLAGSKLVTSSVETSNTDISSEFSKMIVTQQAYSANTKILSTAQQMLQDVLNIVR
jgi:flagellar hook protein FlgE